ncbi:MAG: hypothetical protein U1F43_19065 [Myxococcota bacterium]
MPRFIASILALPLVLPLTALPTTAHAQDAELLDLIEGDLTALSVNLPIWMGEHITSVMAPVGIGAGSGIDDDSGAFKIGVLTRLGLFNNFDDVGYGLKLVDLQPSLPSLVPWPQFGVVAGANLGNGFELGGDVQFIPAMDIAGNNVNLNVALISVAVTGRYRINKADGALPAFIIGLGGSYYNGHFQIGSGYSKPYSETIDGHTVAGTYKVETAPTVEWSIFQLSPELRVAWDIGGVLRPYFGIGLGWSFGTVSDRVHLKASATVDSVDGTPQNRDPVVYDADVVSFDTKPSSYTLRPHIGTDILMGPVALTLQLDLAVMGKDKISTDLGEGASSFDPSDPNYLFNKNGRESLTQSALIGTVALRFQF